MSQAELAVLIVWGCGWALLALVAVVRAGYLRENPLTGGDRYGDTPALLFVLMAMLWPAALAIGVIVSPWLIGRAARALRDRAAAPRIPKATARKVQP